MIFFTFEEIIAPQTLSTITESPFFEYFLTFSAIMRLSLIMLIIHNESSNDRNLCNRLYHSFLHIPLPLISCFLNDWQISLKIQYTASS